MMTKSMESHQEKNQEAKQRKRHFWIVESSLQTTEAKRLDREQTSKVKRDRADFQTDEETNHQNGGNSLPISLDVEEDNIMLQLQQQTSVNNLGGDMYRPPNKALPQEPLRKEFSNKALPPPPDEYSYAAVEKRPMKVTSAGAMSVTVNDKSKIPPTNTKGSLYSYAPVDIRPLAIGINGGVSIPVSDENSYDATENIYRVLEPLQDEYPYSSVNGDDVVHDNEVDSSAQDSGSLYAVVDKPSKTSSPVSVNTENPKPKKTLSKSLSLYDTVAEPVNNTPDIRIEDLYAPVDFSQKRRVSEQSINNSIYPPDFNQGLRRVSDGMLNTQYFPGIGSRKPPPMPKPYRFNDQRSQLAPHPEETELRQRLDSVNRNSISTEDLFNTYSTITIDQQKQQHNKSARHSLPNDERLTKSQNTDQLSSVRNFHKSHRRMRSHENVSVFRSIDSFSSGHSSATISDKSLNRPVSRTNSSSSCSMSNKGVEDDVFLSRNGAASTNYSMADVIRKANETVTSDLPEGWQEVQDETESYFWHIWTGTIQYERPSLSATPTSSSRSVSPFFDSAASSRTPSMSDIVDSPKAAILRPETPDKPKQIISFPVHSMGWMDVDESLMGSTVIGETVSNCISTLAKERKDLFKTSETWAEGEDLKLILEGETLKLVDLKTKNVYHVQPIAKMRVWGVGRDGEEKRDFAYIARDPTTKRHRCHMFRCHGQVSGRSVTNALQAICTRVLDEKHKAKERNESPAGRNQSSDLLRRPSKASSNFNEKPYAEEKKLFTAKYVGSCEVNKPSGIDVVNKVVARLSEGETSADWQSVLVEVTTSEIRTVNCIKQQTTMEHRVRFISFLAVAEDERFGAYIVAVAENQFSCHVYFCAPHAGTLTKAIQEACKMRFEKTLDSQSVKKDSPPQEILKLQPPPAHAPPATSGGSSMKEKTTKLLTSSIAGVFSKLNRRDTKKKEGESPLNSRPSSFDPAPNEHVIKYYGAMPVQIGTGRETVEQAAKNLAHGEMMLGYLEVGSDCVTVTDAQRSPVSQRIFDVANISYCGMTGDRKSFGVVISRGKGKFICHIFQEYRVNTGVEIVDAIQGVL